MFAKKGRYGPCPKCGMTRILTHCDALSKRRGTAKFGSCGWLHCAECGINFHPVTAHWLLSDPRHDSKLSGP
jgi:hypothetical protein